ncbi:hypothetical protein [Luteolibacter sp. Populi]|uniref:hypothetical protein n=1 Tax=Luteolibacter sp. Populi TaxID=3230487 RepID=UPI0034651F77
MRLTCTCTLALTCLLAACALPPEPKAILVEDDSVKPKREKSETASASAPAPVQPVFLPGGKRESVMKINPDIYSRLPDRKDMQATAPPQTTADRGANLMVPAPKPVNE